MDRSSCKHEVYFECPGLEDDRERKKVRTYFQVRRKSGGGDCGPLEVYRGNVYRLAFKEEKDQRAVLEKREHVFSDVLTIVVHGNPHSLGHGLLPSPPDTEFPIAASPSPPIGKELEVHQEDVHHHLKEPSLARKPLEEEFLSIGSLSDKGRFMASSSEQGHPDGFKGHRTNRVDIVGHGQGKKQFVTEFQGGTTRPVTTCPCYVLPGGGYVLVRHGDITKEQADVLVNAANGYLRHEGGVAAALSRAGGPLVQQESTDLVRQRGPLRTGQVVMTTGGNMQCMKLIHIVGPAQGEANGQERQLLAESICSALKLADGNKFQSIAMPCIGAGVFQISVCAEAIVKAVDSFGRRGQHLNRITLIDTREEVVRALQVACDSVFTSANAELGAAGYGEFQESTGASAPRPDDIQNVQGCIETQDVDAIVLHMKNRDPWSTGMGKILCKRIGNKDVQRILKPQKADKNRQVFEVNLKDLKTFRFHMVFFVDLVPWNKQREGAAIKDLKCGIRQVLSSCQNQGFASVAFPALGTGKVLMFPQDQVWIALLAEIEMHQRLHHNSKRLKVHMVTDQ